MSSLSHAGSETSLGAVFNEGLVGWSKSQLEVCMSLGKCDLCVAGKSLGQPHERLACYG